jgi:hypothetical protein
MGRFDLGRALLAHGKPPHPALRATFSRQGEKGPNWALPLREKVPEGRMRGRATKCRAVGSGPRVTIRCVGVLATARRPYVSVGVELDQNGLARVQLCNALAKPPGVGGAAQQVTCFAPGRARSGQLRGHWQTAQPYFPTHELSGHAYPAFTSRSSASFLISFSSAIVVCRSSNCASSDTRRSSILAVRSWTCWLRLAS